MTAAWADCMQSETPATPFAGMTVGFLRPPQRRMSSPACDDCCVGGSHATRIPHSLPAEAGIQRLCFSDAPLNLLHSQPLPQPELHQRIPIKQRNQPSDCKKRAEGNRLVALMSAQHDHRNPH